jgi:hypothetical protein
MDKLQLVAQWLQETYQKPEEATRFALTFVTERSDEIKEFQTWLAAKEAMLKAQRTPESLEAQKLATQQKIDADIAMITSAKVAAVDDVAVKK